MFSHVAVFITYLLFISLWSIICILITYIYIWDLPNTEWVTKVKPNINSVGVPLLLSHTGHILGGRWFTLDQPLSACLLKTCLFHRLILGRRGGRRAGCLCITKLNNRAHEPFFFLAKMVRWRIIFCIWRKICWFLETSIGGTHITIEQKSPNGDRFVSHL